MGVGGRESLRGMASQDSRTRQICLGTGNRMGTRLSALLYGRCRGVAGSRRSHPRKRREKPAHPVIGGGLSRFRHRVLLPPPAISRGIETAPEELSPAGVLGLLA